MKSENTKVLPASTKRTGRKLCISFVTVSSIFLFLIGTLLGILVFEDSAQEEKNTTSKHLYAVYTRRKTQNNLVHVKNVLQHLNYKQVGLNDDWSLLWAFESPFVELKDIIKNLKQHQSLNQLPGCGFLVRKVELSTTPNMPFLSPAFKLPTDKQKFLDYVAKNPNKIFVEKNNGHRNVHIKVPKDISLDSNTTFVQEFVQNPFLVDGYKFDIGVYTAITSIEPLRIYIYTGDVMFRYCQEKYYPFDPKIVRKYVVGDSYRPTWEVPSLIKYFDRYGGSMRASFDAYVRDQSIDPLKIWNQIEEIIRKIVLAKEDQMVEKMRLYQTGNFFELLRFDFIVNENLKVFLMEANMSPNLSSKRFKPNSLVYEQVVYNFFQLVGIGNPNSSNQTFITDDKNLATDLNICVQNVCHKSCHKNECSLCLVCLVESDYDILKKAHREHLHRADMRRIFPKPIKDIETFNIVEETKNFTAKNKWMSQWFYNKCVFDKSWCS